VLAGDSSGGGLVLSLLLTLKKEGATMPGAAVLFCPWLDLRLSQRSDSNTSPPSVPSIEEALLCVHAYPGDHPVDDAIVDPLSADLTGLPPMLIQAAAGDARLADAKALAIRAREQGISATLELYPVDAHVFQLFWSFLPEAADATDFAGNYIRAVRSGLAQTIAAGASASPSIRISKNVQAKSERVIPSA
jgi:acetyl esterase/lipase